MFVVRRWFARHMGCIWTFVAHSRALQLGVRDLIYCLNRQAAAHAVWLQDRSFWVGTVCLGGHGVWDSVCCQYQSIQKWKQCVTVDCKARQIRLHLGNSFSLLDKRRQSTQR